VVAVRDLDLLVEDHEFMVFLGPSGCGKTTTLRCISGLERPENGTIRIGETVVNNLSPAVRDIAMVFQFYALYPHLNARENIAFPLHARRMSRDEVERRVNEVARVLRIEHLLHRRPRQLSGGEQQRVALGRAMVRRPKVFLMDEPLTNLDAKLRSEMRAELKRLQKDLNATTVYVTHDQVEALSLGDRIAVMREGRIIQVAEPMTVYDRPATEFVGSFIGNPPMNFLRGITRSDNGALRVEIGGQSLQAPASVAEASDVLLGIRAENIQALSAAPTNGHTSLKADTLVVEPLGSHLLITVAVEGQVIKVVTRTDFPATPGAPIWLEPEPDKLRWLRAADGMALGI
jgi:multiple sugar transport system ATP-binding protein